MNGIEHSVPRKALAQATAEDVSLQVVRGLAKEGKHGYREDEGIIFRSRLDEPGSTICNRSVCPLPIGRSV